MAGKMRKKRKELFLTQPSYMHFRHLSNKTWDPAIGLKMLKSPFSALLTSNATAAMLSAFCAPSGPRSHFFIRSMVLTQPRRTQCREPQSRWADGVARLSQVLTGLRQVNRPLAGKCCHFTAKVLFVIFFFVHPPRVPFLSGLVVRPSAVFKIQINDAYLVIYQKLLQRFPAFYYFLTNQSE